MTEYPPTTIIRHQALALRDFVELVDADEATVTIGEVMVTYSPDNGFHLLAGAETIDITDWVDQVALVPA